MAETRSLQITSRMNDQASAGFAKLLSIGRGAAAGLAAAFKGVTVAITAISASGGVAFAAFRKVANDLDGVAKAVDRLGVSAESLTALRNGAELAGVSFEDLTNSVRLFEKFIDDAANGGAKQQAVLASLGLTAEQLSGSNLDLVDILGRVGDGLNGLGGSAEKTNTLLQLFGRSGSNLAPLLQQGSAGIQQLAAEAKALGSVFSREQLAQVEAFNDSWEKVKQSLGALTEQIVVHLAPAFTELFKALNDYLKNNAEETKASILALTEVFIESFKVLGYAVDTFRILALNWQLLVGGLSVLTAKITGNSDAAKVLQGELDALVADAVRIQQEFGGSARELEGFLVTLRSLREAAANGQPIRIQVGADAPDRKNPATPVVSTDPWVRFKEGAEQASVAWRNFAQTAYQSGQVLVSGTLDSLTDNISAAITRTKSWSQAWKDLGRSTLGILANVITRLLVVRAISSIPGLGLGVAAKADGGVEPGSIQGVVPLQKFAMGGIAKGPTLALMGEGSAPAEAFVPLPDGKTIPVSFRGAGGGGQVVVNINQSFSSLDAKGSYELLKANRNVIRQFVTDDMQRSHVVRGIVKGAVR